MPIYCATCDASVAMPLGEFITVCKGCSGTLYSFTMLVQQTRAVTFDDISKQREKYNERLKQIEAKERDLAENGGAVHPEMERQLEKMSAATWQIEQRLRVLDFIEEEKNKAVGSDVRKSLKRHDEIEEEDESDSDEGGCESDSDDSDEDESEEEDEKDCSESEEDEEQRTSHGPVPEKTATGKENTPPSNASAPKAPAQYTMTTPMGMRPVMVQQPPPGGNNMLVTGGIFGGPPRPPGLMQPPGMGSAMDRYWPASAYPQFVPGLLGYNGMAAFKPALGCGMGMPGSGTGLGMMGVTVPSPPGEISIFPSTKIVFNAPFDEKQSCRVKLTIPPSSVRLAWRIFPTAHYRELQHITMEPTCGILEPGGTVHVIVNCAVFDYSWGATQNNRVVLECVNCPPSSATNPQKVDQSWFVPDGRVRRFNIPIIYNV